MRELYHERYPDLRCSVLPHSFNEAVPTFTPPPVPRPSPRFVICGSINESCLDAALRVSEAIALVKGARLTLLSGTPAAVLRRLGMLREGVRHESVSRDQLMERLQQADVVVLPHGFHGALSAEEYRTIFPTRTIEYLISGRPILAHAPGDCYLARFLTEHECALVVAEPSVNAVSQAIERLLSDDVLRRRLVQNALRVAEMFTARRVARLLRGHVEVVEAHA